MDSQRNLLFFALLLVSILIWMTWSQDKAVKPVVAPAFSQGVDGGDMTSSTQGQIITLSSDLLSLSIDTQGGDVKSSSLLAYKTTLKSNDPFQLLKFKSDFIYLAQSGLVGRDGIDRVSGRPVYTATSTEYVMREGEDELRVPLVYKAPNNVEYTKTFILKRNSYVVNVEYSVKNVTAEPLEVAMYGQLQQSVDVPKHEYQETGGNFVSSAYRGAAYSTDSSNFKKYSFSDIQSSNLNIDTQYGWVAMLQQYFSTAWIPVPLENDTETAFNFYSQKINEKNKNVNNAIIGYRTSPIVIAPQQEKTFGAKLWIGPELQNEMAAAADHLDLTVNYGWFWFISKPLFILLKFIQGFVHNWGVAIILITFVVRGLLYPLTKAQYTSMAKMRLLQPRVEALRERLSDDRQRLSQEMMGLYKSEKVNPLGGCLPLIIQMPIFLGLFYMLSSSVELRHVPFTLWIKDLSAQDPYYILPLFMGATMFLIQKMSPTPVTDPMQQKLMTFMPLIFTIFFLWFPSGLVLYYTVSNLVTIIQQQLIYRNLEKRGLHTRAKKKK